jgi:hypothetical protein
LVDREIFLIFFEIFKHLSGLCPFAKHIISAGAETRERLSLRLLSYQHILRPRSKSVHVHSFSIILEVSYLVCYLLGFLPYFSLCFSFIFKYSKTTSTSLSPRPDNVTTIFSFLSILFASFIAYDTA